MNTNLFTKRPQRSLLGSATRGLLHSSLLQPVLQCFAGSGVALMYHRVLSTPVLQSFPLNQILCVSAERFEEQIRYCSQTCVCLSVETAVNHLIAGTLPQRSVVVTFDDGYLDFKTNALPILERYQVPAVVFVTTGFVDGSARPWWFELERIILRSKQIAVQLSGRNIKYPAGSLPEKIAAFTGLNELLKRLAPGEQAALFEQLRCEQGDPYGTPEAFLSWEDLRTLDRHPLLTIGAHTARHPVLSRLSADQLLDEVASDKHTLENFLGHEVKYFAYPFGDSAQAGRREFEAAKMTGFKAAFTTIANTLYTQGPAALHQLPRVLLSDNENQPALERKVSGVDAVIQRAKAKFIR